MPFKSATSPIIIVLPIIRTSRAVQSSRVRRRVPTNSITRSSGRKLFAPKNSFKPPQKWSPSDLSEENSKLQTSHHLRQKMLRRPLIRRWFVRSFQANYFARVARQAHGATRALELPHALSSSTFSLCAVSVTTFSWDNSLSVLRFFSCGKNARPIHNFVKTDPI